MECVLRGLDPFTTDLVVADESRGPGSIVLAVSPHLKQLGVSSRCRVFELPKNCNIIFAKPRMKKYIEFSSKIYDIYLKYVDRNDIHIYSIDEAFLDFTNYMKYYNCNLKDIAVKVLNDIYASTGITASCGAGDNMFLAKVALDCLAKKRKNNIAYLNQELFYKYIWDLKPLNKIWGIGKQIEKRLAKMNLYSLRDLANHSLVKLEKEFGVIGRELYEHAHGIDNSIVSEVRKYKPRDESFGYGQVLFSDYNYKDAYTILLEYVDEVTTELVLRKAVCGLIGIGIGYSKKVGGGFFRQLTFSNKTNSRKRIRSAFKKLYFDNVKDLPIRRIDVRIGKLSAEDYVQTDLFTDINKEKKEHDLFKAIGEIQSIYGKNSVNMAISYTDKATKIKRNSLIGGHNAE